SILDQAGALSGGNIEGQAVRTMLGLVDGQKTEELFDHLLSSQTKEALELFDHLYKHGADPLMVIQDLLSVCHKRMRIAAEAKSPEIPALARGWQLLLKGIEEVTSAPNAHIATEMLLIRLSHTASLP